MSINTPVLGPEGTAAFNSGVYFSFVLNQDTPGNECVLKKHLRALKGLSST